MMVIVFDWKLLV